MIGLAQAAAILVAIGLAWHGQPARSTAKNPAVARHPTPAPPRAPSAIRVSSPVMIEGDIEEGRLMVFRMEGSTPQVVDATPPEMTYGVDAMYVMFNVVESIANPRVASR